MLRILNSKSRQKEPFKPIDPAGKKVRMYVCGPTVYDSLHLGHARAAIVPDTIRRYLEYRNFHVRFATNFTDVDDKIIKKSIEKNRAVREITDEYIAEYHAVMHALNVKPADFYPRATDFIPEMLAIVKSLIAHKNAYVASDGDVYFDTASFPKYGALSGRKLEEEEAGSSGRINEERMKVKKNSNDFVLWKLIKNDPPEFKKGGFMVPRWASPWGEGRPGWHIECSAMSQFLLGLPFDIHGGGEDLLFPHHEDEKAQNECAFCEALGGKESVNYWVHNAFINVKKIRDDGSEVIEKQSKSLGNAKWVRDMIWPHGPFDPMALRIMILSSHYRSPIVFEPALLDEATAKLERIYNALDALDRFKSGSHKPGETGDFAIKSDELRGLHDQAVTQAVPMFGGITRAVGAFGMAMDDDFNTAGALGAVFELISTANTEIARCTSKGTVAPSDAQSFAQVATSLREFLNVLGLRSERPKMGGGAKDEEGLIKLLLKTRKESRQIKQFTLGDNIRLGLKELGYEIVDLPNGESEAKKK